MLAYFKCPKCGKITDAAEIWRRLSIGDLEYNSEQEGVKCPKCSYLLKYEHKHEGNPPPEEKSGRCFVATATYGDFNHPSVIQFRHYRDDVLNKSIIGRGFISFYYLVSPYLANLLMKNSTMRSRMKSILDWILKHFNS
jgi:hypothetical protein